MRLVVFSASNVSLSDNNIPISAKFGGNTVFIYHLLAQYHVWRSLSLAALRVKLGLGCGHNVRLTRRFVAAKQRKPVAVQPIVRT